MGLRKKHNTEPEFFPWGFHVFDEWLQLKYMGGSLKPYFEDNQITSIAVYGMGAIGRRLLEELQEQEIIIQYAIDRNASNIHIDGLKVKTLEEKLPVVDAVIVTPVAFYEIEKMLYEKMGSRVNVIFIEDIVDYCLRKRKNEQGK